MTNLIIILICNCSALFSLSEMTIEEKIGQLIVIAGSANGAPEELARMEAQVAHCKVGGVLWLAGNPFCQVEWTNRLQAVSEKPLLIAQDAEWGMGMRLSPALRLPRPMTMGALRNEILIEKAGREAARQCRLLGVHLNFAPVFDVNINPCNPIIHDRSFGVDKEAVARKGVLWMQGLAAGGVVPCAKHFPGHGDTDQDSHHALPLLRHSRERLNEVELYPFREAIAAGVPLVMVGYLAVPALDAPPCCRPAAFSKAIIEDLLQGEMGFTGLVITDALDMQGATALYPPGEREVRALEAGNDLLLTPQDPSKAIEAVRDAVLAGRITLARIERSVQKVSELKQLLNLEKRRLTPPFAMEQVITEAALQLKKQLFSEAMTLVKNRHGAIPLSRSAAVLHSGPATPAAFVERMQESNHCFLGSLESYHDISELIELLDEHADLVLVITDTTRISSRNYGLSSKLIDWIAQLSSLRSLTIVLFGTPYAIKYLNSADIILVGYENDPDAQEAAADVLLGKRVAEGTLPITIEESI